MHKLYPLHYNKELKGCLYGVPFLFLLTHEGEGPIAELKEHRLHDLSGGLLVLTYILNAISTNRVQDLHYKLNRLISQPQIENINDIIYDLKRFITEHPN